MITADAARAAMDPNDVLKESKNACPTVVIMNMNAEYKPRVAINKAVNDNLVTD